jgi:hypothetical protein
MSRIRRFWRWLHRSERMERAKRKHLHRSHAAIQRNDHYTDSKIAALERCRRHWSRLERLEEKWNRPMWA